MKFKMRPHQEKAFDKIINGENGLTYNDRAQYISSCGTGKTFTGYNVLQHYTGENDSAVLFVPSLALMEQTYQSYLEFGAGEDFDILFVCSDKDMGSEVAVEKSFAPTTDPIDIFSFLEKKTNKKKLIFSTYQSGINLSQGFNDADIMPSISIYDEAHRTVSDGTSLMSYTLLDDNFLSEKRLFMTATPRHSGISELNSDISFAMDNPEFFGEIAEEYGFKKAIEDKVVSPYKIVISISDHNTINRISDKQDGEYSAYLAKSVSLINAIKQNNISKSLMFTERIHASKKYSRIIRDISDIRTEHIDGGHSHNERNSAMDRLKTNEIDILSNATLLSEGVDIPAVEMVSFMEKTRSTVSIVQRVGRSVRIDPNNPDKTGYIFLPVFVDNDSLDIDYAVESADLADVYAIVNVLQENDEAFSTVIFDAMDEDNIEAQKKLHTYLEILDTNGNPYLATDALYRNIKSAILNTLSISWDKIYEGYAEKVGHNSIPDPSLDFHGVNLWGWSRRQQARRREGGLSSREKAKLDDISFVWNIYEHKWNKNFEALKLWKKSDKHNSMTNIPIKTVFNGQSIGTFSSLMKSQHRKGTLQKEREYKLKSISFDFSFKSDSPSLSWMKGYNAFKFWTEKNKSPLPSDSTTIEDGVSLSVWEVQTRYKYTEGKLNEKAMKLVDSLEYFSFDQNYSKNRVPYEYNINKYKKMVEKYGVDIPKNKETETTNSWLKKIKYKKRKDLLPESIVANLEEIGINWASDREKVWMGRYKELVSYIEENGETPNLGHGGNRLGGWLKHSKESFEKGTLSKEREQLLSIALGMHISEFGPRKKRVPWKERVSIYKKFIEKHGPLESYSDSEGDPNNMKGWLCDTRKQKNKGKLSKEKVADLDSIGISWNPLQDTIDIKISLAYEFFDNNNCHIKDTTVYKNVSLGRWVSTIRGRHKKDGFSENEYRKDDLLLIIEKNNTLFLTTDPEKKVHADIWAKRYSELKSFIDENGHFSPYTQWITSQRMKYRRNEMTEDRYKLLTDLGIILTPGKDAWLNNANDVFAYIKSGKFIKSSTRQKTETGEKDYGSFLRNAITMATKGDLFIDQIEKLKEILSYRDNMQGLNDFDLISNAKIKPQIKLLPSDGIDKEFINIPSLLENDQNNSSGGLSTEIKSTLLVNEKKLETNNNIIL